MSNGCDPSGVVPPRHRAAFMGWPYYVIDAPATAARAMGTLCKKLGDGKLAADEARALAPAIRRFSRDPKAYSSMRARVGARIEVLTAERRSVAPAVGHAEADRSPRPEARGSGP